MIYRAYDCCVYDSLVEPHTTVWFEAYSRKEASERLTALLALTWRVELDRICIGNVDDEVEMERNSVQEKTAGDRRWIEGGSMGDRPMYFIFPSLVFLAARERRQLAAAAAAAKQHAQEIAKSLVLEAAGLLAGSRAAADVAYEIDQYQAFARVPWLSEENDP